MKTLLLKALGVKGLWIYLVQIIIEMISAQSAGYQHDDDLLAEGLLANEPDAPQGITQRSKLGRVVSRIWGLISPALANVKAPQAWPTIKPLLIAAIAANKALYNALRDAFEAAKAAK